MTERKAPAADDSAAIQRTADRIIRQVGDLLLRHGELSAWAVHKPPGSDWVDAPAEQKIGKWFHFGCYGGGYYFVWPHSIDWESNPVRLFDGICQSLTAILSRQSPRLPDELADWMRGDPTDAMARWVWFASGYATTPLRDAPRTRRKCWGNDGVSYFDADRLEFQRGSLPEILRGRMPPNADCWLVEIKNLLQTTIDAVEYLAELSYEAPAPVVTNATNGTAATNGNEHTEADSVPVVGTSGTEKPDADKLANLKPCWRKAYLSHQYAEEQKGEPLTDREAWEYLNEYGIGDDGNELESYKPPLPGTYADYLNKARHGLGELKYSPRAGRANGSRSIRKQSEI